MTVNMDKNEIGNSLIFFSKFSIFNLISKVLLKVTDTVTFKI